MLCRSPIFLGKRRLEDLSTVFPDGKSPPLFVPCGACKSCRVNASRVWITRMSLESRLYRHSLFLTLTYNDDHLPEGGNLSSKDVTNFFKRLRHRVAPFRYYLCAEYGPKGTHRPHYHAILFGVSQKQKAAIEDSWCGPTGSMGFSFVGECNLKTISYVAKYMVKGLTNYADYNDLVRPFSRMSKGSKYSPGGLGFGALHSIAEKILRTPRKVVPTTVRIGRKFFPIGRYLREKLLSMVYDDNQLYWFKYVQRWNYQVEVFKSLVLRRGVWYLDKYFAKMEPEAQVYDRREFLFESMRPPPGVKRLCVGQNFR